MTNFNSDPQSRQFHRAHEAIVPFAIGLFLVMTGIACGFVVAAMTGALGTKDAAAAAVESVDVAAVTARACREVPPGMATVGVGNDSEQNTTPMFGFLVFEEDYTEWSAMPGFGPLPAEACVPASDRTKNENEIR